MYILYKNIHQTLCILAIVYTLNFVYNIDSKEYKHQITSKGALKMKSLKSRVMSTANRLVKQGYSRAAAMVKAWVLVKLPLVETKVAGTSFGNRQTAIDHLSRYKVEDISITLHRDYKNTADKQAVAVIATVKGKGSYCMGYLPKALASLLSPLMDVGINIASCYKEIKGKYRPKMNYGLVVGIKI